MDLIFHLLFGNFVEKFIENPKNAISLLRSRYVDNPPKDATHVAGSDSHRTGPRAEAFTSILVDDEIATVEAKEGTKKALYEALKKGYTVYAGPGRKIRIPPVRKTYTVLTKLENDLFSELEKITEDIIITQLRYFRYMWARRRVKKMLQKKETKLFKIELEIDRILNEMEYLQKEIEKTNNLKLVSLLHKKKEKLDKLMEKYAEKERELSTKVQIAKEKLWVAKKKLEKKMSTRLIAKLRKK